MKVPGPTRSPALRLPPGLQAGGTLLGFLLGMLFGLAVALGVAVYITKVPLPVTSKNQPRPADQSPDGRINKDWDPNAGLPGRMAARPEPLPPAAPVVVVPPPAPAAPAPASSTPASVAQPGTVPAKAPAPPATQAAAAPAPVVTAPPPSGSTAAPVTPTAPTTASAKPVPPSAPATPAVAVPAAPAKSADPLGDLAKARSEAPRPVAVATTSAAVVAPPAAGAAAAEPFQYFVQAGAYRTPEDAEQQRAKLSLMGLQSRVTERDQAGRTVYRVRLGPFDRRDEADKTRDRLGGNGIEAVVVRMQR